MVDLGGYVIIIVETKDKKIKLYGKTPFSWNACMHAFLHQCFQSHEDKNISMDVVNLRTKMVLHITAVIKRYDSDGEYSLVLSNATGN